MTGARRDGLADHLGKGRCSTPACSSDCIIVNYELLCSFFLDLEFPSLNRRRVAGLLSTSMQPIGSISRTLFGGTRGCGIIFGIAKRPDRVLLIYNGAERESGGIGRRARLRIWSRKGWGFETPLSHQHSGRNKARPTARCAMRKPANRQAGTSLRGQFVFPFVALVS